MNALATPSPPRITTRDRLSSTLFLALVLHGVLIMGVTFSAFMPASGDSTLLRVTMVTERSDTPNPDATELAQVAARGSGTGDDARRSAGMQVPAMPPATRAGEFADRDTAAPGEPQPAPEQLVTRSPSDRQRMALIDPTERAADTPRDAAPAPTPAQPRTHLATPDSELSARGERSELVVSPDTRESRVAPYLARWKWHVERIGTANFPARARAARPARNPVLEVAIGADGRLHDIVLLRPSGDTFLDQAALEILRMAAPFEAFPAELRDDYDVLRFAYEWQFASTEAEATDW